MTDKIDSVPRQLVALAKALVRTSKKAQGSGGDVFYNTPIQRPMPLPVAFLKSVFSVLWVGLFKFRCVSWLFNTRFSRIPEPHPAPPLRSRTLAGFKTIYVLRKLGCPQTLVGPAHRRLLESAEKQIAKAPAVGSPLPIDTIDGRAATDDEVSRFIADHISTFTPCIARGFASRFRAVTDWSVDWFIENYGDTLVPLSEERSEAAGLPLRNLETPGTYLQNCDSIFAAHPELLEHLEIERLERLARPLVHVHPHLFLGWTGSGSPFHCAPLWNVFVQIEGRKAWTWVHPNHFVFMYPKILPLIYGPVLSHVENASADDLLRCPIYAGCPRFEAVLEPGDLMLNPPWWWHRIRNLTEKSCGVATRWVEQGGAESRVCTGIDPSIQTFFSWEAAMGMSLPTLTLFTSTGFGAVKPDEGELTFFESATRYHRPTSSKYLL